MLLHFFCTVTFFLSSNNPLSSKLNPKSITYNSCYGFSYLTRMLLCVLLLQWFTVKRQHAILILADTLYYGKFKRYCKVVPCSPHQKKRRLSKIHCLIKSTVKLFFMCNKQTFEYAQTIGRGFLGKKTKTIVFVNLYLSA